MNSNQTAGYSLLTLRISMVSFHVWLVSLIGLFIRLDIIIEGTLSRLVYLLEMQKQRMGHEKSLKTKYLSKHDTTELLLPP